MKRLRNKKGQSITELALILPMLLILALGLIQMGLILKAYIDVSLASREGARAAALGRSNTEITDIIHTRLAESYYDRTQISLDPPAEASRRVGDYVTVNVNYSMDLLIPIISKVLPDPLQIISGTVMRIEIVEGN